MSYFEIYMEKCRDLLLSSSSDISNPSGVPSLRIREHPITGPFVEGLTSRAVSSYNEVASAVDNELIGSLADRPQTGDNDDKLH